MSKKSLNDQLAEAAELGNTDVAEHLIHARADVNARYGDSDWWRTPLINAADRGYTDTVDLLLDNGARINEPDSDGMTPLIWAACHGCTETVERLMDRGADVSLRDSEDRTAYDWAVINGQEASQKQSPNPETVNALAETARTIGERVAQNEARSLAAALDTARPPETIPEPPARARLSNTPMDRPLREDLGAPDPKPIKPGRMRS
jgi:ankyrin repeat protein